MCSQIGIWRLKLTAATFVSGRFSVVEVATDTRPSDATVRWLATLMLPLAMPEHLIGPGVVQSANCPRVGGLRTTGQILARGADAILWGTFSPEILICSDVIHRADRARRAGLLTPREIFRLSIDVRTLCVHVLRRRISGHRLGGATWAGKHGSR